MAQQTLQVSLAVMVLAHIVPQSTTLPVTFAPSTMVESPHTYHQQKLRREHHHYDTSAPETQEKPRGVLETAPETGNEGSKIPPLEGAANMKTGYSKVARQSAILGSDALRHDDNVIKSETVNAKSMDIMKEIEQLYDDEDDDDDVETVSSDGTSSYSEISPSLSAKDSLTIFMRKHLYSPSEEPMAARLTMEAGSSDTAVPMKEEEISSLMKSRLSDFVKKYMGGLLKAEIQEVRVEQRANGLREYNGS